MMYKRYYFYILIISVIGISCHSKQDKAEKNQKLKIITTTTIIKDIVSQIAGDIHDIQALLPPQASPHGFTPTPKDLTFLSDADVLFINGLGLEDFLDELIHSSIDDHKVISLSGGINIRYLSERSGLIGHNHDSNTHEHPDPHVWMNPENVKIWIGIIVKELVKRDSLNKDIYLSRSVNYISELDQLDKWIQTKINEISEERAKIISDHLIFGYLCDRYNIQQVGAIIPSFSSLAEPSAKELAMLEDIIEDQGVNAVFIGSTFNPALARQLAKDTGIRLVRIYTGSLGPVKSGVESYLDYMKYNIQHITEALAYHGNN